MEQREKKRKVSVLERAAFSLDLPGDVVAGLPCLQMVGDRELLLENYKGILFCGREEIHVDGGKWILRVVGRELEIRTMREHELLLAGQIDRLELM